MAPSTQQASGIQGGKYILTPDEIRQFHEDGYVVLDKVLTEEELAPIEAIYSRFMEGEVPDMGRDFCDMSGPYTREFKDFNIVNAVLPRVYAPELQGNVFEQRAQSIAEQLLGDTPKLDYDQFLAKRPQKGAAVFAWHQDLGYWPTGTPDTLTTTCSLALDDATTENGCLRVVPGSHLESKLRPHRPMLREGADNASRDNSHTLTVELQDDDEVVHVPVPRGSISVHNEKIIHGSGGNASERWRRTYIIAHRSQATVEYERSIGFTHSHNDKIQWTTHLESLKS